MKIRSDSKKIEKHFLEITPVLHRGKFNYIQATKKWKL